MELQAPVNLFGLQPYEVLLLLLFLIIVSWGVGLGLLKIIHQKNAVNQKFTAFCQLLIIVNNRYLLHFLKVHIGHFAVVFVVTSGRTALGSTLLLTTLWPLLLTALCLL